MDNELEALFDDVFSDAQSTGEQPADDDGKQETPVTAAKNEERIAAGPGTIPASWTRIC